MGNRQSRAVTEALADIIGKNLLYNDPLPAYHMHRAGTCVRLPWVTHGWLIVFGGVC